MDAVGINIGYLLLQCGLLTLVCGAMWLPAILAILEMTKRTDMDESHRLIWIVVCVTMPLLGALAYFVFGRKSSTL